MIDLNPSCIGSYILSKYAFWDESSVHMYLGMLLKFEAWSKVTKNANKDILTLILPAISFPH